MTADHPLEIPGDGLRQRPDVRGLTILRLRGRQVRGKELTAIMPVLERTRPGDDDRGLGLERKERRRSLHGHRLAQEAHPNATFSRIHALIHQEPQRTTVLDALQERLERPVRRNDPLSD